MIVGCYQYVEAGIFDCGQIFVGSTEGRIPPIGLSTEGYLQISDGDVCFADFFFYQFKVVCIVVSRLLIRLRLSVPDAAPVACKEEGDLLCGYCVGR